MTDQFTKKPWPRGVKLTNDEMTDTLVAVKTAIGNNGAVFGGATRTTEMLACVDAMWEFPFVDAESAENGSPVLIQPFPVPPFQQLFNRATLADPQYHVTLAELSLSFDQRAEPYAVTGGVDLTKTDLISAADMTRLDMTLRLLERQPSLLTADTTTVLEVLKLEIPGVEAFGGEIVRLNPLLVSGRNVPLKPFAVYVWELSCPGLFASNPTVQDQLQLVSLCLKASLVSELTWPDQDGAQRIQNIPTVHLGVANATTIPLTVPTSNAIITGADIQDALGAFDVALRRRAPSGLGAGTGALGNVMQAANVPPTGMLRNYAHYSMIIVPMFGGQFKNSIRASDVPTAGLPYTYNAVPAWAPGGALNAWRAPAFDRRVVPVPDNFVLHHAFAVWNNYSPPSPSLAGHAAWGTRSTQAAYVQDVSVSLTSGLRGDSYLAQKIAGIQWTGANAVNVTLDQYNPGGNPGYDLIQMALVNDGAPSAASSWFPSGPPVFMGTANSNTQARTNVGNGAAYAASVTNGMETLLECRWSKVDATNGLNDAARLTDVRVGAGGEAIILLGKQTVGA